MSAPRAIAVGLPSRICLGFGDGSTSVTKRRPGQTGAVVAVLMKVKPLSRNSRPRAGPDGNSPRIPFVLARFGDELVGGPLEFGW